VTDYFFQRYQTLFTYDIAPETKNYVKTKYKKELLDFKFLLSVLSFSMLKTHKNIKFWQN
jgi:hypothetical protein